MTIFEIIDSAHEIKGTLEYNAQETTFGHVSKAFKDRSSNNVCFCSTNQYRNVNQKGEYGLFYECVLEEALV